jgi:hypothetical protein
MVDLRKVHARGIQSMQMAYEEAAAEYRQAQLAEDTDGMASAAMRMAGLEATVEKFNNMANRAMNPQPGPMPTNRYGLTPDEVEVAKNSFGAIRDRDGHLVDLSDDQKFEIYARNKARYRHMRQTGEYRDDQGQVRR